MRIRPFQPQDIPIIRRLQPVGWPDITEEFRFYTRKDFCLPLKVVEGKEIIGLGCAILFEHTAWLAHIIVEEGFRNQGIGGDIVQKLSGEVRKRNIETLLLIATELGEPVYAGAGFKKVCNYLFFKKNCVTKKEVPSGPVRLTDPGQYGEVLRLDRSVTGENRERLLREYLAGSYVYMGKDGLEGVYVPGLREGPVLAGTTEAGRALMRLKYTAAEKAVLPEGNPEGIRFLQEMGFEQTGTRGVRMILGKEIPWKPGQIFSRIGGNFG